MAAEELGPSGDAGLDLLRRLVAAAGERPEHRVLDVLVGEWDLRVQWQVRAGDSWLHQRSRATNAWILGGRVLESRTFDLDGNETARTHLAFDPSVGDYVGITMSILSLTYGLERGTFDQLGPALVLEGHETIPTLPVPLRYHRTITFLGDDEHTLGITYPDHPDGIFGGMFIEHRRIGS